MKVSELIEKLKALPQDTTAVIVDADTGWLLNITGVQVSDKGIVEIDGGYGDSFYS